MGAISTPSPVFDREYLELFRSDLRLEERKKELLAQDPIVVIVIDIKTSTS